jgi:hypothetical protein
LGSDEHGVPLTTLTIDWSATATEPITKSRDDAWSKSLRLLRRTLMNVLVDHGTDQRPFLDGPTVRAVDQEIVRREFYKSYPADGDAKKKQAARQKAFRRAIKDAQAAELIGIREIGDVVFVWFGSANDGSVQNACGQKL